MTLAGTLKPWLLFSGPDCPPSVPKDKENFVLVIWEEATEPGYDQDAEWVMKAEGLEPATPPASGSGLTQGSSAGCDFLLFLTAVYLMFCPGVK